MVPPAPMYGIFVYLNDVTSREMGATTFYPGTHLLRADLAGRIAKSLADWSGERWMVSVEAEARGAKTARESLDEQVRAHPMVKRAMELFPGARILEVRELDRSRYVKAAADGAGEEEAIFDDLSLDDPDEAF